MSQPILLAFCLTWILGGTSTTNDRDCVAVGSIVPKTGRFELASSGTLVARRLVLTTFDASRDLVRSERQPAVLFGSVIDKPGHIFKVQRIINHADANAANHKSCLSLLVLERDVPPDVAEPRRTAPAELIDAAGTLRVIGFGANDSFGSAGMGVKRWADIPIVVANCGNSPPAQDKYGCHPGEMVAISAAGRDAAAGDSGGPACVQTGGEWLLAAITDRAVASASRPSGDGGVYLRLDTYHEWIRATAREVSPPAVAAAPAAPSKITASPAANPGKLTIAARSILQSPVYKANMKPLVQAQIARGRILVAGGALTSQFPDCVAVGDAAGRYFATGTLIALRYRSHGQACFR